MLVPKLPSFERLFKASVQDQVVLNLTAKNKRESHAETRHVARIVESYH